MVDIQESIFIVMFGIKAGMMALVSLVIESIMILFGFTLGGGLNID